MFGWDWADLGSGLLTLVLVLAVLAAGYVAYWSRARWREVRRVWDEYRAARVGVDLQTYRYQRWQARMYRLQHGHWRRGSRARRRELRRLMPRPAWS